MANTISKRSILWKCIFAFFPALILLTSFQDHSDQKLWDKRFPLTWEDYKQVRKTEDYGGRSGANTFVGELYRVWRQRRDDSSSYVYRFKVASAMIHSRSYVDPAAKTPALLAHEQLHFDISEYFSRQLLRILQNSVYTEDYQAEVKNIWHNLSVQRGEIEKLYDNQTDHSRNTKLQSKWNEYVQYLLEKNENLEDALKKLPKQ